MHLDRRAAATSGGCRRADPDRDRGSVIVETALVIPVLLAVTVLLVWVASLGATYVRALDAAQTAARLAARGVLDPPAADGISVTLDEQDGLIRARAASDASPPLAAFVGWSLTVRAEAYAVPEWSAPVEDWPAGASR